MVRRQRKVRDSLEEMSKDWPTVLDSILELAGIKDKFRGTVVPFPGFLRSLT